MNTPAVTELIRICKEQHRLLLDSLPSKDKEKFRAPTYSKAEAIASLLVRAEDSSEVSSLLQQDEHGVYSFAEIARQLVDSLEGGGARTVYGPDSGHRGRVFSLLSLVMLEHLEFLRLERPHLYASRA